MAHRLGFLQIFSKLDNGGLLILEISPWFVILRKILPKFQIWGNNYMYRWLDWFMNCLNDLFIFWLLFFITIATSFWLLSPWGIWSTSLSTCLVRNLSWIWFWTFFIDHFQLFSFGRLNFFDPNITFLTYNGELFLTQTFKFLSNLNFSFLFHFCEQMMNFLLAQHIIIF